MAGMRAFHRWFGLVGAVFMIFIATTGLALQLDLWITGNPVPGSEIEAPPSSTLDQPRAAEVGRLAAAAVDAAERVRPGLQVRRVELAFGSGGVRATVGLPGPFADHVALDPTTGRVLQERRMTPGWHGWLQDLHAGYRFGLVGRLISVAMAVALLVLGITGLVIYVELYRRRRRAGRTALFWRR